MPVPQKVDFLVEQAGKPVPKRLIENGARCQIEQISASTKSAASSQSLTKTNSGVLLIL